MLRSSLVNGVLAGAMVSIGGAVLLSVDNRYMGAVLFCIALLSICYFGFNLYTGKVGFLLVNHGKAALSEAFVGLLGNLLGTLLCGALIAYALPQLREAAIAACEKRLTQLPLQTLVRGFFCGVLMYTAVWIYREKKTPLGILFCIPVFILAGFEHSIADMELCRNKLCKDGVGFFACSEAENRRNTLCISRFDNEATGEKGKSDCTSYFGTVPMFYFALAGLYRLESAVFLLLVVLGNSLGGLFIPALQALKGEAHG